MKEFVELLRTVRWQDLLDIFINSYILFRIYVLFHNSNVFRVLVGIAILWISQKIATSLGMVITSWVLQAIIALAAIIIIVVFRNELRSALQIQNLRSFLWGSPVVKKVSPVQVIAESVMQMGRKRIGAILVFPGKEDISEIIHGGIPWNGKVSQEMLMSIFWPNNPVHDGAAIIEGDTVKEVSVLLPLSQRSDLPTFYGTRHRAAFGIAERSDALAVVVSEERGRVTVAKGNTIKAVSDVEELKKLLKAHLEPLYKAEKKEKSFLGNFSFRLAIAGFVSFVIVASAWFVFTRSKDLVMSMDIPIEFMNKPSDLEILEVKPTQITIHISGSSALMRSINKATQIGVRVDLKQVVAGKNIIPLTKDNVILPPGIALNRLDPQYVEITLDSIITKEVDVQIDWEGHLDDNLIMFDVKIDPPKVVISGGRSVLNKISTVYTAPVRLDNIKRSGRLSVPLLLSPGSVKLGPNSPERVVVEYFVKDRNTMEIIPP